MAYERKNRVYMSNNHATTCQHVIRNRRYAHKQLIDMYMLPPHAPSAAIAHTQH